MKKTTNLLSYEETIFNYHFIVLLPNSFSYNGAKAINYGFYHKHVR